MNTFLKSIIIVLILSCSATAQSIASLLGKYQVSSKKDLPFTDNPQISGCAFDPNTGTLLVVDNGNCNIYEITTTGELLHTIALSKFEDVEGIAYQSDRTFIVSEEQRANVVQITIPQSRTGSINWNSCEKLTIGNNWMNSGLEDVTYLSSKHIGYGVKEKSPTAIYHITFDSNGKPLESHEMTSFKWKGISGDAAGVYVLDDGNILLLSQEANTLYGVDTTGNILSQIQLGMTQPEGITFNKADNTIYIVGEPRELAVLKLKPGVGVICNKKIQSLQPVQYNNIDYTLKNDISVTLLGRYICKSDGNITNSVKSDRLTIHNGPILLY